MGKGERNKKLRVLDNQSERLRARLDNLTKLAGNMRNQYVSSGMNLHVEIFRAFLRAEDVDRSKEDWDFMVERSKEFALLFLEGNIKFGDELTKGFKGPKDLESELENLRSQIESVDKAESDLKEYEMKKGELEVLKNGHKGE